MKFNVEDNKKKTGEHLQKLILKKYDSQRQFAAAFFEKQYGKEAEKPELDNMARKISAIIKGRDNIQTYDLPLFCELLGVSCEQILSAGKCFRPIKNHVTNYEVAHSKSRKLWDSYMNREDKLFLNYDEYGKSVVDYALEFHNYDFMKYLMDEGYLKLVDNSKWERGFRFGLSTDIKRRERREDDIWPIAYKLNVPESIVYQERLRTKMITLAIENYDYDRLEKLKARMNPAMDNLDIFNNSITMLEEQRDDELIEMVATADERIIKYFTEEFEIEDRHERKHVFMFPYLGKVIDLMVSEKNPMLEDALDKAIKHNKSAYEKTKEKIDEYTEILFKNYTGFMQKDSFFEEHKKGYYDRASKDAKWGFNYNEKEGIVSYNYSKQKRENDGIVTNLIIVSAKSKDSMIAGKIREVNEWAEKTIELGKAD